MQAILLQAILMLTEAGYPDAHRSRLSRCRHKQAILMQAILKQTIAG
jgi:hypothetical protein